MECELKITAGQGKITIRGNSSLITGNPLQYKNEILEGIEKVFLILGGEYQIVKVTEAGNGTFFEFTRENPSKEHGVYALPRNAEKFLMDNHLISPQDKEVLTDKPAKESSNTKDHYLDKEGFLNEEAKNIVEDNFKKAETLNSKILEEIETERHKDKIKLLVDINPYFDRFEIHGTEVFWKRKVIFFKNGKKVKTITGWKDHMYCTDCLFEKNKIVDLLTMPDETVNCPFCNGPMLEVS